MGKSTRHSAILIGAYISTSLLNYTFGVGLSWFFSPDQFGVLGVAQSLLLLVALAVGSGFTWTAAQDIAANGINENTRRRFRSAFITNATLGLILAIGVWYIFSAGWLPLGPAYKRVIPLVGLTTFLLAARSVINGAARGLYRFTPVALNLVGEVAVKVAFGLALVAAGVGVEGVMFAFALGAAASLIHSLWIVRSAKLWRGRGWFEPQTLINTAPLFIGMLGTALILNLDVLGLKLLSPVGKGDHLAGLYQAAIILARTPVFIAQALTLVLFSYAAGQRGVLQNSAQKIVSYSRSALKSWTRLLVPGALVLILAPQAALSLFFPEQYHEARVSLQVASIGGLLLALSTLLIGVYQAEGKRRQPAIASGVAVIIQIITLILLVPAIGTLGAAVSLLLAGAVSLAGLTPLFWPELMPRLKAKDAWQHLGQINRNLLPLLTLSLLLILLPDGNRLMAGLKLSAAGLGYLLSLIFTQLRIASDSQASAYNLVSRFMQVLIGG